MTSRGAVAAPPASKDDSALAALKFTMAPLCAPMSAEGVTDLVVNRPGEIGIERNGRWEWSEDRRLDLPWLEALAMQVASYNRQTINAENPTCSATLPTGERVQIVRAPAVVAGQCSITIRKPPIRLWSTLELEENGLFALVNRREARATDEELRALYERGRWRKFLKLAVKARKNIVISGATGSGKTSLARALMAHVQETDRLITGEDTHELVNLPHRNVVNLLYPKDAGQAVAQVWPKTLMEAALRMRPDRVIFPELRDGTAYYFLRSVASGHPGVVTTIHANNCRMAWEVLTLLVRESDGGADLEREDIRGLLRQTVDIVVQIKRVGDRRLVTEIQINDTSVTGE
jgi:type IV secretion system protein VirB11